MSSVASVPSTNNNSHALKRNSGDIGWDYGVLVDPNNLNVIKCIFCPTIVKAGIYRLKCHIAGIRGDGKPCPSAPDEDRAKCKRAIEDSRKAKRARIQEKAEVRDVVDIEGAPDEEDVVYTMFNPVYTGYTVNREKPNWYRLPFRLTLSPATLKPLLALP